ncbi:MAG: portal protein, partial [Vicinamibacteria bacterium]
MIDPLARKLLQRFEALKAPREAYWEPKWQEIADHVIGRRDFTVQDTPGRRREIQLYDTTGRTMVDLLAGGLHSLLVNPASDWFDLRTDDPALMEVYEVQLWLEEVKKRLYAIFHSPEARFTAQMDELFLDLVGFGTAGLFIGDPPGRQVLFSSRPLSELFIAESAYGVVDTVFRKFQLTARQTLQQWGPEASDKAKAAVEGGRPETPIELLHAVMPSEDPTLRGFAGMPFPWSSHFLDRESGQLLGRPGGFHELPYVISRWRVDGGEVYGRGPAENSLAEQKMVSAMKLTTLQAGQMAVAPPFLTEDDSSIVQLDLRPFGRNIVRPGGMLQPPIQALDVKSRAEIGVELIRDSRQQVEASFHFELLKLIQNPGLTPMTAQQVRAIRSAVERLLSPILGRQHTDVLGPLIDRTFGIAVRRGQIPTAPAVLQGRRIEVEYLSPINRAQKEGDAEAAIEFLALWAQGVQVDPSIADLVDVDEAYRFIAQQKNVPPKLLR